MTTKAERITPLPAGLSPLFTKDELATYFRVSEWTVRQWVKAGCPTVPMDLEGARERLRFELAEVRQWHAGRVLAATA